VGEDSTGCAGGQLLAVVASFLDIRIIQNRDQLNNFVSSAHRWVLKLSDTCYRWGEKKRGVGSCINKTPGKRYSIELSAVW